MRELPSIPGWSRVRLGDAITIQTGFAKGAIKAKGALVRRPYLRAANVQDGHLDLTDIAEIDVPESLYERCRLRAGDVLIVEASGNAEKVGCGWKWSGEIEECLHQNHVFALRADPTRLSPDFLAALVTSSQWKAHFRNGSGKSTSLSSINTAQVKAIRLALPPENEQRAIVRVLSVISRVSDRALSLYKARRTLKRGLLQQLLSGQRRFPEFCKQPWVEHRLGDLFEERIELGRVELPLLSITADRGIVPRDSIDRSDTSSADKSLYKRIAPGDIGYNTMRMWQGVSALSSLDGIVSPAYTICSPRKGVHGAYFAHLFKFPPVIHRFWRYSQGLVDDTLNLKFHEFSQVRVNVPSDVREQERIATLLDTTDLELAQLRAMHDALKKQKKGMMQKLLTGQIRVPASMLKEANHG